MSHLRLTSRREFDLSRWNHGQKFLWNSLMKSQNSEHRCLGIKTALYQKQLLLHKNVTGLLAAHEYCACSDYTRANLIHKLEKKMIISSRKL